MSQAATNTARTSSTTSSDAGPFGPLAALGKLADSRSGSMLIGVGIVLMLWQFIAGPEIKAAREADRTAMREIAGQLKEAAVLLNSAASRIEAHR